MKIISVVLDIINIIIVTDILCTYIVAGPFHKLFYP